MSIGTKFILSASRRTDIPAFYLEWFMDRIRSGFFDIKNPYSKMVRRVPADPESIYAIVFWSKDYGPFLKTGAGEELNDLGYHLYFNFTINSESPVLEPELPPLAIRLKQMEMLASQFGPETISWRFDPICFFQTVKDGHLRNNFTHFPLIAQKAASSGIEKCVTSFYDGYAKIDRRIKWMFSKTNQFLLLIDPPLEKKIRIVKKMADNLADLGMELNLCCEKKVYEALPPFTQIRQNACIDGHALKILFNEPLQVRKDTGQRARKGCQCTKSIDIGSYEDHPCPHDCIFCYANPLMDTQKRFNK